MNNNSETHNNLRARVVYKAVAALHSHGQWSLDPNPPAVGRREAVATALSPSSGEVVPGCEPNLPFGWEPPTVPRAPLARDCASGGAAMHCR